MSQTLSETRKRIKAATPVGYTGETRRAWVTKRRAMGSYRTVNKTHPAMFLEEGTQAHGPVSKKRLFIPLTRRAFYVYRAQVFPPLQRNVEYLLVPFVKGIKARKMAAKRVPFAVNKGTENLRKIFKKL